MKKKNYIDLAEELRAFLGEPSLDAMAFCVWADSEDEMICVAPAETCDFKTFYYVKEVALFAAYHDMSLATQEYETGAGLRLYY